MKSKHRFIFIPLICAGLALLFSFQNCSKVSFATNDASKSDVPGDLSVCDGVSCTLDPLTQKPAVTTILLALGDEADSQLVVKSISAQLIAETVVRYSTPQAKPKILVVQDQNIAGEDPEDTEYVVKSLLKRYDVDFEIEPTGGLTDGMLEPYDLVWFNNPGHAMTSTQTRDALIRFRGGVVLQGDDLTVVTANKESLSSLTGLEPIDNGTTVNCAGKKIQIDNNNYGKYLVTLDPQKIPGANSSTIHFEYGNDIDNSIVVGSGVEVLATAKAIDPACVESRPTIVRYMK